MKLASTFVLVLGCASSSPPPSQPVATEAPAIERDRQIAELPAEAHRLLAAHDQLVSSDPSLDHVHVIRALDRLADALEIIVPGRADDISRVRESARQLQASGPDAGVVRTALQAAASALQSVPQPDDVDPSSIHALRLQAASLAVENAAAELEPGTPLREQIEYVQVAVRESTRAVFAALGAPEPEVAVQTARR